MRPATGDALGTTALIPTARSRAWEVWITRCRCRSFGAAGWGYYETLAGGAGGTPFAAGASAVHTHMTNTRLTDPEVLEARYPVRLIRSEIRRGSGGEGAHRGGDGLIRELEFLAPLSLSILSERRERSPWGLDGGGPGQRGSNRLDGRELGGRARVDVQAGQRLCIETPGGGGWGRARLSSDNSDA